MKKILLTILGIFALSNLGIAKEYTPATNYSTNLEIMMSSVTPRPFTSVSSSIVGKSFVERYSPNIPSMTCDNSCAPLLQEWEKDEGEWTKLGSPRSEVHIGNASIHSQCASSNCPNGYFWVRLKAELVLDGDGTNCDEDIGIVCAQRICEGEIKFSLKYEAAGSAENPDCQLDYAAPEVTVKTPCVSGLTYKWKLGTHQNNVWDEICTEDFDQYCNSETDLMEFEVDVSFRDVGCNRNGNSSVERRITVVCGECKYQQKPTVPLETDLGIVNLSIRIDGDL
jgi:hypothetical protein